VAHEKRYAQFKAMFLLFQSSNNNMFHWEWTYLQRGFYWTVTEFFSPHLWSKWTCLTEYANLNLRSSLVKITL